MRDEVIYRCVNQSCARSLPRRVNYCPYCGIGQVTAMPRPVPPRATAAQALHGIDDTAAPAAATAHPDGAAPRMDTAWQTAEKAAAARTAANPAANPAGPVPPAAPPPAAKASGASVPPGAGPPAGPPPPRPIRLRWIVLALAALWIAWLTQRPAGTGAGARLDSRIDKAVAMAVACKANEAQAELIALKDKATPAQLARLQGALDEADLSCRRGASTARGKAAGRAAPRAGAQQVQSARNLLADARSAMTRGDYRAAADKMEVCIAMVDADTRDCSALKARAERLDGEQRRCLARGAEWVNDGCQ